MKPYNEMHVTDIHHSIHFLDVSYDVTIPTVGVSVYDVLYEMDDPATIVMQHLSLTSNDSNVIIALYPIPGLILNAFIAFNEPPTLEVYSDQYVVSLSLHGL